ncbi:MAG: hypothetical protein AAAB35_08235 [Phyllobacterium sp.]|uniref:hypothetical protein n=1 Tax=Phyllobacterium sp. TaxID=1871046 RepID=UPI0030F1A361
MHINIPKRTVRPIRNGFVRPEAGTLTGLVWDLADEHYENSGKVPTVRQIVQQYMSRVQGAKETTCRTQYWRWIQYHDFNVALKRVMSDERMRKRASRRLQGGE